MKLPESIRIGYATYTIQAWDVSNATCAEAYGCCDHENQIIYIYEGLDGLRAFDTLLHEILHAVWHFAKLPDSEEEEIVHRLATMLTMVKDDNPDWCKLWSK